MAFKLEVTIPGSSVPAALAGFPVYIDMSGFPQAFWDGLHDPWGADIHVRNSSGAELPFDLVWISVETKAGCLFVKTNLSDSSDTLIYVCFGSSTQARPAVTDPNGRNAVWSDFHRVFMFGDYLFDRTGSGERVAFPHNYNDPFTVTSQSPELGVHQGVAWDGACYYITGTNAIKKYDSAWNLIATYSDPCSDIGGGVDHLGDPEVKDGIIYIPTEFWQDIDTFDHMKVSKFSAGDLSYIGSVDVSAQGHEASSICWIPEDDCFYISEYRNGSDRLYRYSSDLSYIGTLSLSTAIDKIQGLCYWRGAFWVNSDETKFTYRVERDGSQVVRMFHSSATYHEGIAGKGESLITLNSSGLSAGKVEQLDLAARLGVASGIEFDGNYQSKGMIDVSRYAAFTVGCSAIFSRKDETQIFVTYGLSGSSDSSKRTSLGWTLGADQVGVWNSDDLWVKHDPLTDTPACAFKSNFSGETVGSAPVGWTERWNAGNGALTVRNDGLFGTNCIELAYAYPNKYAASIDSLGTAVSDCEILALIRPNTNIDHIYRVAARGGGSAGSENVYFGYMQPASNIVGIHKYVGGVSTTVTGTTPKTIDTNKWYYLRFRVVGTSLKLKVWELGSEEPEAWDLQGTDSSLSSGWIGTCASNGASGGIADIDYFAVTTGAVPATVPLPIDNVDQFMRLHMLHNGTTERKFYLNGSPEVDSGCAERPAPDANVLYLGSPDSTTLQAMDGILEFLYLRAEALSDDWIAAESSNLSNPGSFVSIGPITGDEPPTEVRADRLDISGNGRHLSDAAANPTGNVQGKIGNAAYFSGSGEQLLRLAEAPDLTGDEEFTVAFRMKPHLKSDPAGDIYWHFRVGDLEIRAGFAPGQTKAFVSASTPSLSCNTGNVIPANVFSFISVYFDTAGLYIDVNDSNKASAAGSGTGIVTPAAGIEAGNSAAIEMNISIDELGLWVGAGALSAAQRTTLYSGNYGQRPTFS